MYKLFFVVLSLLVLVSSVHARELKTNKTYRTHYLLFKKLTHFSALLKKVVDMSLPAVDEKVVSSAINGVVYGLDKNTSYYTSKETKCASKWGHLSSIGLRVVVVPHTRWVVITELLKGFAAYKSGLRVGDFIFSVDGKWVRNMSKQEVYCAIHGSRYKNIIIKVKKPGSSKIYSHSILRKKAPLLQTRLLPNSIGYIRLREFYKNVSMEVKKYIDTHVMSGMILDLRDNTGGSLLEAIKLADILLSKGKVVSIENRRGKRVFFATAVGTFNKPLVCLVNGGSISSAEIVAAAIRDNKRGLLIGTSTYGKGSIQSVITFMDRSVLVLTTGKWFPPKGKSVRLVGVKPHVMVRSPRYQLKVAIQRLNSLISK